MAAYFKYRNAWRFNGAPHLETQLETSQWKPLLKEGGLLVRNTFGFDLEKESSFWYVIKDHYGDLAELRPRVRNKIRHALGAYDYRLINLALLQEQGFAIVEETFADYAITDRKTNKNIFSQYLLECEQQNFDYWGVFEKETSALVGFCCVRCWTDSCEYDQSGMKTHCKHNATYPYYGLFHAMNRYYLDKKGFKYVSDGSRSITEHSQIHDFLIQNFNFRKAFCHLEVHYQWWMKITVNVLYPFRKIITLPRVKAILNMEAMQRGEK